MAEKLAGFPRITNVCRKNQQLTSTTANLPNIETHFARKGFATRQNGEIFSMRRRKEFELTPSLVMLIIVCTSILRREIVALA
jgi:hypothetical protein